MFDKTDCLEVKYETALFAMDFYTAAFTPMLQKSAAAKRFSTVLQTFLCSDGGRRFLGVRRNLREHGAEPAGSRMAGLGLVSDARPIR